ncbi:MAG: A/G-specific adenine glycosylase [Oscillospiraceae bacterium]|nr:A/G-specific adenine glycosylase [Oscillospiraceae bacterium]
MPQVRVCRAFWTERVRETEKQEILNAIAVPLLAWYDVHKRTLPWRGTKDPYQVWVSEIMLQQTRVAAVLPYYERWMRELPDVEALAAVENERLMKLWEGLGYYSRVRNMQKAAKMLLTEYNGKFPQTSKELCRLPGIGSYTAGAIASIAFGEAVPAVDGNVLRVAARTAGIADDIMDPNTRKLFQKMMEKAVPKERPGEYNQALMDLGAVVCVPNGAPDCGQCPLAGLCVANRLELQNTLPVRAKKAKRRVEELTLYLLVRGDQIAMRKRPEEGLLAGLWEFPHVPGTLDETAAAQVLRGWGVTPLEWQKKITGKHIFTHVEWHMTGYLLTVRGGGEDFLWAGAETLQTLAVPSAFGKFLEHALRRMNSR